MTKRSINNIILFSILPIYTLLYRSILLKNFMEYGESICASFMILLVFVGILLLGWEKDKPGRLKSNIIRLTITQIILFFSLAYGIGFVAGFLKNAYSLKLLSIINNIFAPLIIMVGTEVFRYIVITANKDKKEIPIIITILLIIFELAISIRVIDIKNYVEVFRITSTIVLPIIIKNMTLSYLTYNAGYKPSLIYRLIMDMYVYILPIIPDLGDYLNSMLGICLPVIIYVHSSKIIDEYQHNVEYVYDARKFRLKDVPIIIFILIFAMLISGKFTYSLIGIGSDSMAPKLNRGDAVFVHKVKDENNLKRGEIIVFKPNGSNKMVIHRLKRIENKNGNLYYITQGDANNIEDVGKISFQNIKGEVKFRIPYIAYPSVWISEFFERAKEGKR